MVTEPTTASKEAMKHKTLTTPPHEDVGGGTVLPAGGNQGDVLAKHSDLTDDLEWKTLGTAANKDYTANVRPDDHRLVESNAVYAAISAAISAIYEPHGEITCEELTSELLIPENVDNLYTVSDSGTTTDLFIQGEGKTINAGDSVAIIVAGPDVYKFNLMPGIVDLSSFQEKTLDTPVEIEDVEYDTVEDALQALADAVEGGGGSSGVSTALARTNLSTINYNGVYVYKSGNTVHINGAFSTTGQLAASAELFRELPAPAFPTGGTFYIRSVLFDGTDGHVASIISVNSSGQIIKGAGNLQAGSYLIDTMYLTEE